METLPSRPKDSIERYTERVGRLTMYRHGETNYTNQYPDLLDQGKWKFLQAGHDLRELIDGESEDVLFVHSPSPRAKASMAYLLKGMGVSDDVAEGDVQKHAQEFKPLRSSAVFNPEKYAELVGEHVDQDDPKPGQHEAFDRVYMMHDHYETSPHAEPRSRAQARGRRVFRQAMYLLIKNHTEKDDHKTPHVVAISHLETLQDIAGRIYGLDIGKDPLFARGERLTLDVKTDGNDMEKMLLIADFRGEERKAWFHLATGEILPVVG
jgi:broad specificity phosphatase PhoE